MKHIISNKTRNLGYGYNTEVRAGENSPYRPRKPDFVGTVKQIREQLNNSKDFQLLKHSGTYYNWDFFYGDERIVAMKPFGRWETDNDFDLVWEFLDNLKIKFEIETERIK